MGDKKLDESCVLVIFGARGDLSRRKLIPAVYHLAQAKHLPQKFQVVGFARDEITRDVFRRFAYSAIEEQIAKTDFNQKLAQELTDRFHYFRGDIHNQESFSQFSKILDTIDREQHAGGNRIYYFATPPGLFAELANRIAEAGMTSQSHGWRRIIIEKPFGHDLESAKALNESLGRILKEEQIYRIDHYLGKETVQNILVFRFANGIFEPTWNRRYIDSIQITVAETLGVEQRAAYYEQAGALRDMVSSHLLQLLCLVAMEPPTSFSADDVRDEKVKALKAIKPLSPEDVAQQVVRGQYNRGRVEGTFYPGYHSEPGVSGESRTETFVALKLELDNWRWAGVPFYLRTGKRLAKRATEIAIQFKCAPFELFRHAHTGALPSNFLVMRIQPDEGMTLSFSAKAPGPEIRLGSVEMDFKYVDYFGHVPSTGYETLLYDCINGDRTLFRRADQVECSWQAIMPILDVWNGSWPRDLPTYPSGSWGPSAANQMLEREGRRWRNIADGGPEIPRTGERV